VPCLRPDLYRTTTVQQAWCAGRPQYSTPGVPRRERLPAAAIDKHAPALRLSLDPRALAPPRTRPIHLHRIVPIFPAPVRLAPWRAERGAARPRRDRRRVQWRVRRLRRRRVQWRVRRLRRRCAWRARPGQGLSLRRVARRRACPPRSSVERPRLPGGRRGVLRLWDGRGERQTVLCAQHLQRSAPCALGERQLPVRVLDCEPRARRDVHLHRARHRLSEWRSIGSDALGPLSRMCMFVMCRLVIACLSCAGLL
jgi:hypothetical protein